jgi:hypothetical protein
MSHVSCVMSRIRQLLGSRLQGLVDHAGVVGASGSVEASGVCGKDQGTPAGVFV